MTERFKAYLEKEFRTIAPTKAAMDYRKATLTKLLEYAQDCRLKGMSDEDAIFHLAIDSLGDFQATLKNFEKELTERPKRNNRRLITALAICLSIAIVIGLFVGLSVTNVIAWKISWLIPVGAILISISALLILLGFKIAKRKSYVIPSITQAIAIILLSTFVFLMLIMLSNLPYAYFTFLIMVILILILDIAMRLVIKSKITAIEIPFAFVIVSSLVFVMLGISKIMPWHPGWLLPALSVVGAVVYLIVLLVHRGNKKKHKVKKSEPKPTHEDEKYYTEW